MNGSSAGRVGNVNGIPGADFDYKALKRGMHAGHIQRGGQLPRPPSAAVRSAAADRLRSPSVQSVGSSRR